MDRYIIKKSRTRLVSQSSVTTVDCDANTNSQTQILETETESEPLQKKKKKYAQNFRKIWIDKFPALEDKDGKAYCNICCKTIVSNYNHILRHFKSASHIYKRNIMKKTAKIDSFVDKNIVATKNAAKAAEFKLVAFLHEHNLPFLLMDHLPKFIVSVCPDSTVAREIKISRTKATNLTKNQLMSEALTELKSSLNINKLYSLIIDETTDVSTQKSLAVLIRFFDDISIKDRFLGLVRVEDSTANGLFVSITKLLQENEIPMENMVGFAADNAAVMMGNKNGVQARFKEVNPHIVVMGCICHSMHLCASAASEKLPKSVEEFLRNVINYFSNSAKRNESFKEYQEFVKIKPRKLLKTSQTRWLSLQAAVERVLQSWDALTLYFTNVVHESSEEFRSTTQILENLKHPIYKVYIFFLSYVLGFVNNLNKEFQSETCKIDILLLRLTEMYKTFLRNYLKTSYLDRTPIHLINVQNPDNFIKIEDMYFGAQVEKLTNTINFDKTELSKFKTNALTFYVELCKQIKKRIDFNDPLLTYIKRFSPKDAMSGDHNSITKVLDFFPQLLAIDLENLNTEYRLVASVIELQNRVNSNFEEFWTYAMNIKNGLDELMFPNLSKVIKVIMTIPHSSGAAESLFSQLTLIKNKQRNRLEIDTCDAIMHTKSLLTNTSCFEFKPSQRLLKI